MPFWRLYVKCILPSVSLPQTGDGLSWAIHTILRPRWSRDFDASPELSTFTIEFLMQAALRNRAVVEMLGPI